ncbi:carboxylesterase/lipase family protein [Saccharothrix sp. ST-888]|uniref:carboxylesterase/lipase family protein n=1 Tax=Saccharothrix sp. ST-888 TaxID=1427391 RepID=UPI0005ED0D8B|nr:carboxylesterase family protein [Saccharothrix sp. ST-888]KJK55689.1 carboxylesterase [Saccharothrix sp. ST-888]
MSTPPPAFPVVRTAQGAVRGVGSAGIASFRGIPYARPPVGPLRFAAPAAALPWDGVREAFAFGPAAPQPFLGMDLPAGEPGMAAEHEWLTVNVWTPETGPAGLPVMVWFYGGGYLAGDSSVPTFDGARLAREGRVVVVSFNYRVGVEGFAQIDGAVANRGLLDQLAALRWVQQNITAFGGDPQRVTAFGQSAGAGSIAALLAMPDASGLFRRAVLQSVPRLYFSSALARDIASELAALVWLPADADALRALPPHQLVEAAGQLTSRMPKHADRWGAVADAAMPFAPVVDGEVLPQDPWTAVAAGSAREVELLIGHTRDEYRLYLVAGGLLGRIGAEQAGHALRTFVPGPDGPAAYRAAHPSAEPGTLLELACSDWLFRMPTVRLAEAQAAAGGSAHLFEYAHTAGELGGAFGACHGSEVPLVFGSYTAGVANPFHANPPAPATEALGVRLRRAWTGFASTGSADWPHYTPESRLTRVFDTAGSTDPGSTETPQAVAYPHEAARAIWAEHPMDPLDLRR